MLENKNLTKNQRGSSFKMINYLTKREKEVLCHAGLKTTENIAAKLFVSKTTIRTHLNNIYQKLHSHNRHECIVKALKKGIITVDELVI